MKTYNFTIERTYQTKIQLTAENEIDARHKLIDYDLEEIEKGQNKIVATNYHLELQREEKAELWFKSRGIDVSHHTSFSLVLPNGMFVEISDSEVSYRARLWDNEQKG